MMEELTLTNPETTPAKTTTGYRVKQLLLESELDQIGIVVRGTNGELKSFSYEGTKAHNMIIAINKANNSVKSMHKRILEQLATDFPEQMGGVVTGAPE